MVLALDLWVSGNHCKITLIKFESKWCTTEFTPRSTTNARGTSRQQHHQLHDLLIISLPPISFQPVRRSISNHFGGIDASLFEGTLYEFDTYSTSVNAPYGDQYYFVQISDIRATSSNQSLFQGDEPYPILVDSGTVQILLPQDQADAIGALASATYHNSNELSKNYFIAACSNVPFDDSLTFTMFGQLDIIIAWTDIVYKDTSVEGECIIPIGYAQHRGGGILVCPSEVKLTIGC
jgi:Eukaryotic aspartyl protease